MSEYVRTQETVRIICNLDFSLVLPSGVYYCTEREKDDPLPEFPEGREASVFDLTKPRPAVAGSDFTNPIAMGVIRNYTAGLFIQAYGHDVKQVSLLESKKACVICADRTDNDNALHFVVITARGLYGGRLFLYGMSEKARVEELRRIIESFSLYDPSPAELAGPIDKEVKRADLEKDAEIEAKARQRRQKAIRQLEGEPEEKKEDPEKKPEPEVKTEPEKAPAPQKKKEEEEPVRPRFHYGLPDGVTEDNKEPEKKPEPVKEETPEVSPEEEERIRIRKLEDARSARIEALRHRYSGNPEVESGIDNYIARVERAADDIIAQFRSYLGSVQQYAVNAQFTSEEDPAFIDFQNSIRDQEAVFGRQMDALTESLDENAEEAEGTGITEAFVERFIRVMERLDRKYDSLAVSLNQQLTIAYERPEKIDAITRKWRKKWYQLPGNIEDADRQREIEIGNAIQYRIQQLRGSLNDSEAYSRAKEQELTGARKAAEDAASEAEGFEGVYTEKKQRLEEEIASRRGQNQQQHQSVQADLDENQAKLSELEEELSKTFALNMNRKKSLNAEIENTKLNIAEDEDSLGRLESEMASYEREYTDQTAELEEEHQRVQKEKEDADETLARLQRESSDAKTALEQLRSSLESSEDEWRHVHENYLLGKYDEKED